MLRSFSDYALVDRELHLLQVVLHHPNVLKIHSCLNGKQAIYLVMDFLGSHSLETYLMQAQGKGKWSRNCSSLPFNDVCNMVGHITRGLDHCHTNHVCHRDLKFGNLMIDHDDKITLVDFGLAFQMADSQMLHRNCGTVPFVAPEVAKSTKDRGYNGLLSDLWSFGVLLIELVCGNRSVDRLVNLCGKDSQSETIRKCSSLADSHVQQEALNFAGCDIGTEQLAELASAFHGLVRMEPTMRINLQRFAQLGFIQKHVGHLQPRRNGSIATIDDAHANRPSSKSSQSSSCQSSGLGSASEISLRGRTVEDSEMFRTPSLLSVLGGNAIVFAAVDQASCRIGWVG